MICQRLEEIIEQQNHQVTLLSLNDQPDVDLKPFDKIVLGASIRYGRHSRQVYKFIARNLRVLEEKASAFFSVNVVARKPGKNRPETNPYVRKFLRQIPWKPKKVAVFAGKIDYPKYCFRDRQIIRLIMWMSKGPTDPNAVVEFTDWRQVDDFARMVSSMQRDTVQSLDSSTSDKSGQ